MARINTRGWTLDDFKEAVSKYKSLQGLKSLDKRLHSAFKRKFPEALDALFPPVVSREITESEVRETARRFKCMHHFAQWEYGAYKAAEKLGILGDLGFRLKNARPGGGQEAAFYLATILLNDGSHGIILGVTSRHPGVRYSLSDLPYMTDRGFYLFMRASDASNLETRIKSKFLPFAVEWGDSPLEGKSGTSGEILKGVLMSDVIWEIESWVGEGLPKFEPW